MTNNLVALLPISIGSKKWNHKETLKAYIAHMHNNYPQGRLLLVDTPKIHNTKILEKKTQKEAEEKNQNILYSLENTLHPLVANKNVKITRFSNWWDEHAQHNLGVLHAAYECDSEFKKDIDIILQGFTDSLRGSYAKNAQGKHRQIAEYLLEEFAGLSAMSLREPQIEIYPTQTKMEKRLYNDKYTFSNALRYDRNRKFEPFKP